MIFRRKKRDEGGAEPAASGRRRLKKPGFPVFAGAAQLAMGAAFLALYFATYYLPYAAAALCPLCGGLVTLSLELLPPREGRGPRETLARILPALPPAALAAAAVLLLRRYTSLYKLTWAGAAAGAATFVLFLILEKVTLSHSDGSDGRRDALLRTSASMTSVSKFSSALLFAGSAVTLLGFYDLTRYLPYALIAVYAYSAIFLLISLAVRSIRREIAAEPDLSIPLPFSRRRDFRITGYLEKNTGITMHSLWSMKFIFSLIPYTIVFVILTVWLSTAVTLVGSGQRAVVYRLGRLESEPLEPGLHLTLPFPFDSVEKYDTERVRKLTVGYISDTDSDNIWTGSHGSEEFQLLLGDGNELVSVNLRIEYKISDIIKYLTSTANPEKLIEAQAYNLITDRVIRTDLETLMSVDRRGFADSLREELSARLSDLPDAGGGTADAGIEIVSVVLESIHPPVSVASKYQELISAGIKAEKMILDAEAYAAKTVAESEKIRDVGILEAEAAKSKSVAEAQASVTEFMAGVAADSEYSSAYRYEKYLSALSAAYGGSKLIILGDGIDRDDVWIGNPALLTGRTQ